MTDHAQPFRVVHYYWTRELWESQPIPADAASSSHSMFCVTCDEYHPATYDDAEIRYRCPAWHSERGYTMMRHRSHVFRRMQYVPLPPTDSPWFRDIPVNTGWRQDSPDPSVVITTPQDDEVRRRLLEEAIARTHIIRLSDMVPSMPIVASLSP